MKSVWKYASVLLDVVLVLFALLNIFTGEGSFFDYFIVVGELVLVIPATVIHYYRNSKRKSEDQANEPQDETGDISRS